MPQIRTRRQRFFANWYRRSYDWSVKCAFVGVVVGICLALPFVGCLAAAAWCCDRLAR